MVNLMVNTQQSVLITQFDNLDSRRELHRQFAALRPSHRYDFIRWACSQASPIGQRRPELVMDARSSEAIQLANIGDSRADDYVTAETWGFLVLLTATWGVPIKRVAETLESVARGKIRISELSQVKV
jgi:hypothetical protein